MAATLMRLTNPLAFLSHPPTCSSLRFRGSKSIGTETASSFRTVKMAGSDPETTSSSSRVVIDSHLHIWASPQEVVALTLA